ncbi:MAG TPA: Ig-like domain-containing protein [Mycobacterium sp.]
MVKRFFSILAALLFVAGAVQTAWAALTALGEPIDPHGFPAFYSDGSLALEPCLPPPAGYATRQDLCLFDPVDPNNPESVDLGVGAEIFWWAAEAQAPFLPGVTKGKTLLVLALEGAFAVEEPKDGEQMTFGRVRIRVDVPVPGTYTVTHPFGTQVFENVTVADGINYTADIGDISILNPALGFTGALGSAIGPFLTWPNYDTNSALQVRELDPVSGLPTGPVLEQYVGNPNIASTVAGGPNGNIFRVTGPNGISTETNLFNIMGKVYDADVDPPRTVHTFPDTPPQNLFAVGPVNREGEVGAITPQQPEGVRTGTEFLGYPKGFPLWYQESVGTVEAPEGGVQLTLCPGGDPMCISEPVDPNDPGSVELRIGGEGFWWSGEAFINEDTADVTDLPASLDGLLVLAMEAAFGGDESIVDGNQIGFGRLRIRVDVPTPGDYTITHPYGEEVFTGVTVADGINFTRDIMIINTLDPDSAFVGALYSDIGPTLLTWPEFANREAAFLAANPEYQTLQRPLDPNDPASPVVQYVGDPAVGHEVTGGPNGNFFRIQGPDGIDVQTGLFAVTGKVFDPATFETVVNPNAPVANTDEATTPAGTAVTINILANDTITGAPVDPALTTVTILPVGEVNGPFDGSVLLNADKTVTYTPAAGFAGTDNFAYQITVGGLISNVATVTIDVVPVETIALRKARLDLRRLQFDIQGTNNIDGATLTIYPGATAAGTPIGTALADRGRWSLRTTATSNPNVTSISIRSSNGGTLLNQPLQVR